MIVSEPQINHDSFGYHFFSLKKNLSIRYGVMNVPRAPAKGIFLLLHGRSEFIEKYKSVANRLQSKGFKVISPDWRGQGLSSREVENRQKGHINSFDEYVEDLSALYSEVIEPEGIPAYILSHSMGGNIALMYMSRNPFKIKKAVLASPMIDIALPGLIYPVSRFISKKLSASFFAKQYAIGSKNYDVAPAKFKGNKLSHDPHKYMILHDEIKKNPNLAIGGVTWGWLNAAFESIEVLKKDDVIKRVQTPTLIIGAQKDSIVSLKAQEKLSMKLPICEFHSIEGAFHELMFEEPRINRIFWSLFDRFVLD